MTAEFLRGAFTALFIEGILWTFFWVARRWYELRGPRCPLCDSQNLDESGHTIPLEALRACPECGETMMSAKAPKEALQIAEYLKLREAELLTRHEQGVDCAVACGMSPEDAEVFVREMEEK